MSSRADEKLIIVPYQPGNQLKRLLLALVVVLLCISAASALSWYAGLKQHELGNTEKAQMQQQVAEAQQQVEALNQQIAVLERGRAIDNKAKQEVQATIFKLENSMVQLKEDIAFYKNIMAPSGNDKGLKIEKLDLWPGTGERSFRYKMVMTQVADNSSYIQGLVAVNLIGYRGETKEILALRDVDGAEDLGLKFRFRFFQNIEGNLSLPEGFKATQVQVVAQASGKKATKIERTFDWKVASK